MNINTISQNNSANQVQQFGHGIFSRKSDYSLKDRAIVAGTTILGGAVSCAILAKKSGYSLKPSKIFKNIGNSYLANAEFEAKPVITIGAGTCLGGLAGGYIIDKNSENRKAKRRETVMQIGNISIPILTVHYTDKLTKKLNKVAKAFISLGAVLVGVTIANYLMNKLSNVLFKNKENERGVKATDFSAHLDDFVLAAHYVDPKSKIIHGVGRLVPAALLVPGLEIGMKKSNEK